MNASGFVSNSSYLLMMRGAVVEKLGGQKPIAPVKIAAADVVKTENGFTQAPYNGQLVELEGEVVELLPSTARQLWAVRSGSILFQVQLTGVGRWGNVALEPGTRARFTGICIAAEDENEGLQSFRLLLRSPEDIRVQNAPYSSSSLLLLFVILLLVLLGSAVVWFFYRRRNELHLTAFEEAESIQLGVRWKQVSQILALSSAALGLVWVLAWVLDPRALR